MAKSPKTFRKREWNIFCAQSCSLKNLEISPNSEVYSDLRPEIISIFLHRLWPSFFLESKATQSGSARIPRHSSSPKRPKTVQKRHKTSSKGFQEPLLSAKRIPKIIWKLALNLVSKSLPFTHQLQYLFTTLVSFPFPISLYHCPPALPGLPSLCLSSAIALSLPCFASA